MKGLPEKLVAAALMLTVMVAVSNEIGSRYLDRRAVRFRRESKDIQMQEAAYRRPMLVGEPLEENAAVWYRQALPHFTAKTFTGSVAVLQKGFASYDDGLTPELREKCAEINRTRIQSALRCTRCDWELGTGIGALNGFEYSMEAVALGRCFTLDGHRLAHAGHPKDASRSYLAAISFGCDLGVGDAGMVTVGMANASLGLLAIARLATTIEDRSLLEEWDRDIARFRERLPNARLSLRRERLWLENVVALNQLDAAGGTDTSSWARTRAAWRLWRTDDRLLKDFDRVMAIHSRSEGITLADELGRKPRFSGELIIDFRADALLVASTLDLAGHYQATRAAIRLQQWRLDHGTYPADKSVLGLDLDGDQVVYEPIAGGRGYKLTTPQGASIERTPI